MEYRRLLREDLESATFLTVSLDDCYRKEELVDQLVARLEGNQLGKCKGIGQVLNTADDLVEALCSSRSAERGSDFIFNKNAVALEFRNVEGNHSPLGVANLQMQLPLNFVVLNRSV